MSGGIVKLIAIGQQDTHFTGDPEISYFRSTYKRYTNFAQYINTQVIQGNPSPGGMSSIRLEKKGDLLNYMFITAIQNNRVARIHDWTQLIDKIEFLIGGSVVDTQDSVFTEQIAIDTMSQKFTQCSAASLHNGIETDSNFYPLRFFCCENWNACLPLVCLENHEVDFRIHWGPDAAQYRFEFAVNFICLDDAERNEMRSRPKIDILIHQVQKSIASSDTKVQEITLNHPVKFLASSNANTLSSNPLASVTNKLKFEINGLDISEPKFSCPYYTTIPSYYHTQYSRGNETYMFLYPFCLDTTKYQPTGSLNFSRVSTFKVFSEEILTKPIYAVNYNILRVQNGMAGVLYAN